MLLLVAKRFTLPAVVAAKPLSFLGAVLYLVFSVFSLSLLFVAVALCSAVALHFACMRDEGVVQSL